MTRVPQLEQVLASVDSKETFLRFISTLCDDWEAAEQEEASKPSSPYGANARGWENITVGRFLDSMHAWTVDSGERVADEPSWKTFAEVIYAGKIYE